MAYDENPLDRISSGPAPTGPSPWRSNRLPTGSPYTQGGLYGTGEVKRRRRLGRAGWITLVVAIVLVAGAVGWAAVSKPGGAGFPSPIGDSAAPPPPPTPSVGQVTGSSVFTTALASPPGCALPPLATTPESVEAFARAGTVCLEAVWSLRAGTVRPFSSPDDVPPGTGCFAGVPVATVGNCNDAIYLNVNGAIEAAGNQAPRLLQWLALAVAGRAENRAGVAADIGALIRSVDGASPLGIEYRKRDKAQSLCLSGATIQRLVDHGITRADVAQASAQARVWTLLGEGEDDPRIQADTAQQWFDRGSLSPTQEVCRTAWTVPVDQVS
ncbi:hypothetical protein [Tsukamurella pulmonis]|uniref:hypothetical protein n=1 Tax=Tsukamurella pulmonis TaxID=47312 RepID=UPI000E094E75|nr:hypothetical protein [Tsukamurella pulmonis]RDH13642.1 hypothetical protein DVB88_01380 [Tsukamurella pulmonis]